MTEKNAYPRVFPENLRRNVSTRLLADGDAYVCSRRIELGSYIWKIYFTKLSLASQDLAFWCRAACLTAFETAWAQTMENMVVKKAPAIQTMALTTINQVRLNFWNWINNVAMTAHSGIHAHNPMPKRPSLRRFTTCRNSMQMSWLATALCERTQLRVDKS